MTDIDTTLAFERAERLLEYALADTLPR